VTNAHPALAGGSVYLDYNATTPVDPRVVEAMLPYLTTHFGNPSSVHAYAEPAHAALDPSPVLQAMGLGRERALSAVRLSLGRWTSDEEVDHATSLLAKALD
jgi:cysteine sulfinate desulfinase/cysteine desulfurase-like protein